MSISNINEIYQLENVLVRVRIRDKNQEVITKSKKGIMFFPVASNLDDFIYLEANLNSETNQEDESVLWHANAKTLTTEIISKGLLSPFFKWVSKEDVCYGRGHKESDGVHWDLFIKNVVDGKERVILERIDDYFFYDSNIIYLKKTKRRNTNL